MPRKSTPIPVTCACCGAAFTKSPKSYNRAIRSGQTRFFCSRRCQYTGMSVGHRSPTDTVICEHCGTVTEYLISQLNWWNQRGTPRRFCSKSCADKARYVDRHVELVCEKCGTSFGATQGEIDHQLRQGRPIRFCSRKCANEDLIGRDRGAEWVELTCRTCNATFQRRAADVRASVKRGRTRFYCSRACRAQQVHSWTEHGRGVQMVRPDLGHMCRSTWEANVCRVLRALNIPYQYEPVTFNLGESSYTPDLHVAGSYWIEIKGYMRPEGAAKIAAFRAAYPSERMVVVGRKTYAAMTREWADRIPEWEHASPKISHDEAA